MSGILAVIDLKISGIPAVIDLLMSGIAAVMSNIDSGFGIADIIFAGKSNSESVVGLGSSLVVDNAVVFCVGNSLLNASCLAFNDF